MKRTQFLLSAILLCAMAAALLIGLHVRRVNEAELEALPLTRQIPLLKRRAEFLEQQLEVTRVHAEARVGSLEERFRVHVLPTNADATRFLAGFDMLRSTLSARKALRAVSPLSVGKSVPLNGTSFVSRTITLHLEATQEGANAIFGFLRLPGLLTIEDAFADEHVQVLLERTESENPAAIAALEQFLSMDLLSYCIDRRAYEEKLLAAFAGEGMRNTLQGVLSASLIESACRSLPPVALSALKREKLWPMPFTEIVTARLGGLSDGWMDVQLTLRVLGRK
jgi:hypothetical protein